MKYFEQTYNVELALRNTFIILIILLLYYHSLMVHITMNTITTQLVSIVKANITTATASTTYETYNYSCSLLYIYILKLVF